MTRVRKLIYDNTALLGSAPDDVIALQLGLAPNTIASARRRRRIPSWQQQRRRAWCKLARRLGRTSDAIEARKLGVSAQTVTYWRWQAGIPAWRPRLVDLDASILQALGRVPIQFHVIRERVVNDFGSVNDRTLWRHLGKLVKRGVVLRQPDEDTPFTRYRLSPEALRKEF